MILISIIIILISLIITPVISWESQLLGLAIAQLPSSVAAMVLATVLTSYLVGMMAMLTLRAQRGQGPVVMATIILALILLALEVAVVNLTTVTTAVKSRAAAVMVRSASDHLESNTMAKLVA